MTNEISNDQNILDSRDVIERLDELQSKFDAIEEAKANLNAAEPGNTEEAQAELDAASEDFDEDERAEYHALKALADEAEGYADDWRHGATLIRETYFTDYCKELCRDIGDLPKDVPRYIEIDWDATANNLRVDYTEVEFNGETYLIR